MEELENIIEATKKPFRLHVEIAKEFRVSVSFVSSLYRESLRNPEKLKRQKEQEELDNQKKLAIEDAVNKLLDSNKPIVRAQQVI